MKCPKCGYLGFETTDRCKHCGYDFSLAERQASGQELPLQRAPSGPLVDLDLGRTDTPAVPRSASVDLDRVIGGVESDVASPPDVGSRSGIGRPGRRPRQTPERPPAAEADAALPLFAPAEADMRGDSADDASPIAAPRPAGTPLAVRRATPDVPRGRGRGPRVTPRRTESPQLDLDASAFETAGAHAAAGSALVVDRPAAASVRAAAAAIDIALMAAIGAAVLYFTLAIAGLSRADVGLIPPMPFAAFLLLLVFGYIACFTAASGQTIGKMVVGLRVVHTDGARVDTASACIRAAGCVLSLLTLGLAYLPALGAEGRALHDRLAGTRVVDAR